MVSNRMRNYLPSRRDWLAIFLGTSGLLGLYAISRCNFLLFHCLAEAFSIVIAIAVFAIFWNTRRFLENGVYLVLGFGCLFAGILDLIYIFAYPGMSVFPAADGNIALQAKTVAQWFVSLSCVGAFAFLRGKVNQNVALAVYSGLLGLALASIFYWRIFPDCYVEGLGQTLFERIGLVVSCIAYLGAIGLLIGNRGEFDRRVFNLMAAILAAFFLEDAVSAVATDINGPAKTVAHLCQVVALFFVYKAFVEVGLTKPYDLLFRSQQQSTEALQRQRQFLEAVLDNTQTGIVACDAHGVLTLFNRALRELHGLPQQSIPAEQWAEHYDLYRPDGKTRMTTEEIPLFRALQGQRVRDVEMRIVPKAGAARTCLASGGPLTGEDGAIRGAVVSMQDITERKRAEQENLELERRLLHAQKLESLGVLAGGIAHDFNNILAGIMGYADLALVELPVSEPGRENIAVIKKAVQRAADLTRQMLAYSGKGRFIVGPLSMSRLVQDSKQMLAMSVSKKATVTYDLAADLPVIEADASQMSQVVMNLVINASEALGEQGGTIAVSTRAVQCGSGDLAGMGLDRDLPEGLYVCLQVADTGCGMDEQTRAKIFDPFFTTKFTGRGLGLAAVHGIVRGHKGAIDVRSAPGKGTAFRVLFPAGGPAALAARSEAAAAPRPNSGLVLVVDDEALVRTLAAKMLERAGFSVLVAGGGREAIRLFGEHRHEVRCVLLDLTMPDLDGAETLRELRRIRPDVRVVLSSGYGEEAAGAQFADPGPTGFLQKPYKLNTLIARIQEALDQPPVA